jgi:hypothetical protein
MAERKVLSRNEPAAYYSMQAVSLFKRKCRVTPVAHLLFSQRMTPLSKNVAELPVSRLPTFGLTTKCLLALRDKDKA